MGWAEWGSSSILWRDRVSVIRDNWVSWWITVIERYRLNGFNSGRQDYPEVSNGFQFPYSFPLGGLLLTVAGGLLLGAAAALLPASSAAHMDVVEALRYE